MLKARIDELDKRYEDLKDKINVEKAQGNLSKLFDLKREFDETFDEFFDNENIRKKYDDLEFEKSNNELLARLDKEDLEKYVEFYENYIDELKDELSDLRSER